MKELYNSTFCLIAFQSIFHCLCIFKTLILSNHFPAKNSLLTPHTRHLVGSVISIYGTYFLRDSRSQCPGQDQAQRTLSLTVLPQVVKLFKIQMSRSKPCVKVLASQRLDIENAGPPHTAGTTDAAIWHGPGEMCGFLKTPQAFLLHGQGSFSLCLRLLLLV